MDELRVRVYGVRFGDAILITVPDRTSRGRPITRHILIDVGNVRSGAGGEDDVFGPVVEDVQRELDGKPLDLYIMTHEHLDHVQGLYWAAEKLGLRLSARYAWLTASAAQDYYERYPQAKEKKKLYEAVQRVLAALPGGSTPWLDALMLNNNPSETEPCVAYLRGLAPANRTTYVYRGCSLRGRHPFRDARFAIWAPEEDTSAYYGRFQPLAAAPGPESAAPPPALALPEPPPGVDTGAFYNLLAARAGTAVDNLLAIDAAGNNSSVVLALEWHGWRLLFTGDAEQRSWKTMHAQGQLRPVHFFKVSHHGSATGLPEGEILETILPACPPDDRPRQAVVSTYPNTYQGVPDRPLLRSLLHPRCTVHYVDKGQVGDGEHLDLFFPGL